MAISVLLSIKPEFVERILNGSKQFEFRRRVFKRPNVEKIVIYATSPVCKVIGEFEIEGIIECDIEDLWQQTQEFSGIQKSRFEAYFNGRDIGYAIRIGKVSVYEEPLSLQADLNVKHPPQSFIYVNM